MYIQIISCVTHMTKTVINNFPHRLLSLYIELMSAFVDYTIEYCWWWSMFNSCDKLILFFFFLNVQAWFTSAGKVFSTHIIYYLSIILNVASMFSINFKLNSPQIDGQCEMELSFMQILFRILFYLLLDLSHSNIYN